MRHLITPLVVSVVAAAVLAPVPALAAPAVARCGAVLTTDAYLTGDLTCTGDAVTLTGNIVLDLRGHRLVATGGTAVTVTGDGSPRVQNGRIADSAQGLAVPQEESEEPLAARTIRVSRVTFARNGTAINVSGTNPFFAPGRATSVSVWKSRFLGNTTAIGGVFTGPVTVARSTFADNHLAVRIDTGSLAVDRSRFLRNQSALECEEANPCRVTRSRLWANRAGITVRTGPLTLWRSRISGSDTALSASNIGGIRATGNAFTRNRVGVELLFASAVLRDNTFYRNTTGFTADSLGEDGVEATLIRNRFTKNTDGIFTESEGVRLKQNRATANRRWGIYAPHATDLGGNRSTGNGQSPPCVGVAC